MDLDNRVIIVTGGAKRLGRTYCLGLARAGAKVVVADISDPRPVVNEIFNSGGQAIGAEVDICDPRALDEMVETVMEEFGPIHVLINNAGYFRDSARGSFQEVPIGELERSLEVNVKGTWLATRAVVPGMRTAGYGETASVMELGPDNICVNSLLPDAIPDEDEEQPTSASLPRAIAARCFQRKQTPQDMIGTVVYLCGSGSDFVTGQSFHVNGGAYFT